MDARETVARHAALAERRLPATILPYWLRSVDEEHGGYRLHDDVLRSWPRRAGRLLRRRSAPPGPDDKQLVDQARLVWVCAHAHRKGLVDGDVALRAASSGYEFLHDHFLDPVHGGYFEILRTRALTLADDEADPMVGAPQRLDQVGRVFDHVHVEPEHRGGEVGGEMGRVLPTRVRILGEDQHPGASRR